MGLQIGGSTIGYDVNGMQQLLNDININVIPSACSTMRNESQKVRSTISTVWVGSSAEAFKDKLDRDTTNLCSCLVELGEAITDELNNAGSNVEDYDAEIASQLFPGYTGSSSGAGGGADGGSDSSFASQVATGASSLAASSSSDASSKKLGDGIEKVTGISSTAKEVDTDNSGYQDIPVISADSSTGATVQEIVDQASIIKMMVDENVSNTGATSEEAESVVSINEETTNENAEDTSSEESTNTTEVSTDVPAESEMVEEPASNDEEIEELEDDSTESPSSEKTAVEGSEYETPSGNVAISKPESGFQVTTGNTVVELNEDDFNLLCGIVQRESSAGSYDDKLAVASVILNRTEDPAYVASNGTTVRGQIEAPNQFSTYNSSYSFDSSSYDEQTKQAVMDALSGIRNNEYLSFRSNASTGYSDNTITETGNRYK